MIQKDSVINYVNENLCAINNVQDSVVPISDKITPLIWLLFANILLILAKFLFDIIIRNKEVKNNIRIVRAETIANLIVENEKELFLMIQGLSTFSADQSEQLLSRILDTEHFIEQNILFIRKSIYNTTVKSLDYYKTIASDFKNKDIKLEVKQRNDFFDKFHG